MICFPALNLIMLGEFMNGFAEGNFFNLSDGVLFIEVHLKCAENLAIFTTKQVCPANDTEVVRYRWFAVGMLITLD